MSHPMLNRRSFLTTSAAVAFLTALSACGSDSGSGADIDVEAQSVGAMEKYEAGRQFTATEPIKVSMLWTDWPEYPVKDSWIFFEEIKRRTNVEIELTHIPFSDAEEKRSLLISAGDAPDIIPLVYTGQEAPFVSSGAILPMSDYIDYMPNFRKLVEDWGLAEMVDNLKQADGKNYMLPGLQEVSVPAFSLVVRKDVFEDCYGKIPDSWDELHDALVAIKEKYPDSKPLADGFEGQSILNYAAHAFGAQGGWGFGSGMIADGQGGLKYTAVSEEYKAMLEYFHGLVKEGLLDTESMTVLNATTGTVPEKFVQETCFAASGASFTVIEITQAMSETLGAGSFEVVQIAPPAGPKGPIVEPRAFWHGFMLNSRLRDSENLIAILQFIDWLYFNEGARELVMWGVKGQTYSKADDGTITLSPEYSLKAFDLNTGAPTDIKGDLGFANDVLYQATESRALKESYQTESARAYIDTVLDTRTPRDPNPPAPLDEDELEQASLLATPLKDTVDTVTLQFILGERPLGDWEAYVSELEAQGLQSYVDLINGARERFAERNA